MFEASDFDLPLEAELKQRVIFDEVEQCEDVKVLQESLKNVTKLFMRYEHLLHSVIAKQMEKNMHDFLSNYGELNNEQV
jgi:hypothetical protein